jgi:hypothetical protein
MTAARPGSAFDRAEHCRRIAASGGKRTAAKYGRSHMSRIGKAGFRATVETRGFSDAGAFINWLVEQGRLPKRKDER